MAASYFDVDGTLVSTNLIPPTLYYLLNLPTPIHVARTLGKALLKAPVMAYAELQDRRLFNEVLFSVFEGISEDRLITLADDVFERVLRPNLLVGARDLVKTSLDKGHEVILVSGALEPVVHHMADYLGASGYIANRLEIKDLFATGKLLRPVVAGPNKALLVRDHARAGGHNLDECFAYSDSYSDVPMLSIVGYPVTVNPDRRLRQLARAYNWPVIELATKRRGSRPQATRA
jgi:HAD superfamily hydrolase (TIGR01490 family)